MRQNEPKVVVITGASAGVGRAVAREFAKQGAKIGLIARGTDRLLQTKDEIETLGGKAIAVSADVADPRQIENAADTIESELGPIDVWINNAMVSVFSPIKEMTAEEFRRVTEVTYLGYVHGTLAALRRMQNRNSGVIIQVGSALAYRSIPLQSAYCAAKHAVLGFTESLRTELLHDKSAVKVCMVHLPAVNTPQFLWSKSRMARKAMPVPPVFQPEVPARAIVWAAEHPKREIYLALPTFKAIWAEKIFPKFADRYLAKKGYNAQQTDEPENPNRANNLWEPVAANYAAHGPFDQIARKKSIEFELRRRIASIATIAATFTLLLLFFARRGF